MKKLQLINVEKLNELMAQKGLSCETLAQLSGIKMPILQMILNGADQRRLNISCFYGLVKALEVHPRTLIHQKYLSK